MDKYDANLINNYHKKYIRHEHEICSYKYGTVSILISRGLLRVRSIFNFLMMRDFNTSKGNMESKSRRSATNHRSWLNKL